MGQRFVSLISILFFHFHYLKAAIYLDLSPSRGNLTCVDVGWLRPCCDVISGKIMKCLPSLAVWCIAVQGKEQLITALQCIWRLKVSMGAKMCWKITPMTWCRVSFSCDQEGVNFEIMFITSGTPNACQELKTFKSERPSPQASKVSMNTLG